MPRLKPKISAISLMDKKRNISCHILIILEDIGNLDLSNPYDSLRVKTLFIKS